MLALVFLTCLAVLGAIGWQYLQATMRYDDVAESAIVNGSDETDDLSDMIIDWDYLRSVNPDTVGWVIMPGANIDYPIVQGSDDDEYLTRDFNGDSDNLVHEGCIFLHCGNNPDFTDSANFIFGHSLADGSMFSQLAKLADDPDFSKHGTFCILTPSTNYRVSIYAVSRIGATDAEVLRPRFETQEDFRSYISESLNEADSVNERVDPLTSDKVFALITCGDSYATTRVVVFGCVTESVIPTEPPESR